MAIDLRYDPLPFILSRGGPAEILSLLGEADLLATSLAREYLLALLSRQRPDGGFPSTFDPACFAVRETEQAVRLLVSGGLGAQTLNVAAGLNLLLETQRPDGSWSENPALDLPPATLALSTSQGVTWLTAEVARTLQMAGSDDTAEAYWAALDWLYTWQGSDGGWPLLEGPGPSDPSSSTLITFLLEEMYSESDPVVQQGRAYYERCLTEIARDAQQRFHEVRGERHGLDVYHLVDTVLEPEMAAAGYDIHDERVAHVVEAVVDIQRRDGGWRPFWLEESDPGYTAYTLRALVWVGALEREELAEMLRRYVR
jgi:hypothetical protein